MSHLQCNLVCNSEASVPEISIVQRCKVQFLLLPSWFPLPLPQCYKELQEAKACWEQCTLINWNWSSGSPGHCPGSRAAWLTGSAAGGRSRSASGKSSYREEEKHRRLCILNSPGSKCVIWSMCVPLNVLNLFFFLLLFIQQIHPFFV